MSEEQIAADVADICDFEGRLAGTDAERRASKLLATRLGRGGRQAHVDAIYVQPQWAIVHFLHCALGAIGSMVSVVEPPVGFALVLIAATSAYFDLSGRHYLLRRLPFRRASQNVHTLPPTEPALPMVVLCANLDAPHTGAAYNRLPVALLNNAAKRFPVLASPTRIWFWSIALLLPPLGARMAGFQPDLLAALQLPQTLILIVACFLLGEIALSPASPGANANASGVAGVLDALRRLDADPPEHLRTEAVVLGGGQTTMEGMRAFLREHRSTLDRKRTWFISLESIGRGEARYLLSQGPTVSLPLDSELVELSEVLSQGDSDGEGRRAAALRDGGTSAALVARAHGFRALAITCREESQAVPTNHHTPADTPDQIEPAAIARADSLVVDVIRLLDRDLSRRAASADAQTAAPEPEPELRPA